MKKKSTNTVPAPTTIQVKLYMIGLRDLLKCHAKNTFGRDLEIEYMEDDKYLLDALEEVIMGCIYAKRLLKSLPADDDDGVCPDEFGDPNGEDIRKDFAPKKGHTKKSKHTYAPKYAQGFTSEDAKYADEEE